MGDNRYSKPDYWARKAAAEKYPARSVYKLKELHEKFNLIPKRCAALDLGAAPGSWTVCLLRDFAASRVVSCDVNALSKSVKGENLTFIQGDLNSKETREAIKNLAPFDVALCDAAPLTTGSRVVDTARSEQLVEMAVWYAESTLRRGGNFAVKIFQNGSQGEILKTLRGLFAEAKGFKPKACRSESFETYLVGVNRL